MGGVTGVYNDAYIKKTSQGRLLQQRFGPLFGRADLEFRTKLCLS